MEETEGPAVRRVAMIVGFQEYGLGGFLIALFKEMRRYYVEVCMK